MKKRWYLLILIALVFFWYGEKRSFYCLDNNKCITVWKTYNNTSYIIPGKYYGLLKPSDNYIKTTNMNDLTIYFVEDMVNSIFIRCEKDYTITNDNKTEINIIDYYKDVKTNKSLIYGANPKSFSDVYDKVNFIDLTIQENYAIDKNGVRIE